MKAKKVFISVILIVTLVGVYGLNAFADTGKRASNLKSKGVFSYENGKVLLDSSDLTYLADEIDLLEEKYKESIVSSLENISSYYDISGDVVHESPDMSLVATSVPFVSLSAAITNSQEIYNEGNTYTNENGEPYYKAPDGSLTVDSTIEDVEALDISAASADNLSAGTAAWVDGELIIGTGVDNKAYADYWYSKGIADGLSKAFVEYVYHEHTGNESEGGGCYTKPVYHTHTNSCKTHYYNPGTFNRSGGSWKPGESVNPSMKCPVCGGGIDTWDSGGGYTSWGCKKSNCGSYVGGYDYYGEPYTCGLSETIIGYNLGCGKTEKSIEYATIKFD